LQKAAPLPANVFDSANGELTLARNTNPTDVHTFASVLRHLGPRHVAGLKAASRRPDVGLQPMLN
jgi:hypothetical protein